VQAQSRFWTQLCRGIIDKSSLGYVLRSNVGNQVAIFTGMMNWSDLVPHMKTIT